MFCFMERSPNVSNVGNTLGLCLKGSGKNVNSIQFEQFLSILPFLKAL